ncbi:MAG: hypothetical protein ACYTFY_19335, partial [Planctomycetota bacterium]
RLLVFTREGSFNKINNSALEFAGTEVLPSVKSKEKLDLIVFSKKHQFWQRFLQSDGTIPFKKLFINKYNPLKAVSGSVPLLGLKDGSSILNFKQYGKGIIYFYGSDFTKESGNIVLKASFLALAQQMALFGNSKRDSFFITAGELPALDFAADVSVSLTSLISGKTIWQGKSKDLPTIIRSGIYQLSHEDHIRLLSVSDSADECNARFLSQIPDTMKNYRNIKLLNYSGNNRYAESIAEKRTGVNLFIPLLLAAVLVFLLEGYLASGGRSKRKKSPQLAVFLPAIEWQINLPEILSGMLAVFAVILTYYVFKLLCRRLPPRKSYKIVFFRSIIVILVIIALFDPAVIKKIKDTSPGKLLILSDTSKSMDVKSSTGISRFERSEKLSAMLADNLPDNISAENMFFNSEIYTSAKESLTDKTRGTDIAAILKKAAGKEGISGYREAVIITDGGDERIAVDTRFPIPLSVAAVGVGDAQQNDIGIESLKFPESVEINTEFNLEAVINATAVNDKGFKENLKKVEVILSSVESGKSTILAKKMVNLSNLNAAASFKYKISKSGRNNFKVAVKPAQGELSVLNNIREFTVMGMTRSIRVLYYTTRLGMSYKMLRSEIAKDPGVSFTAMFQVMQGRFSIHGERQSGDKFLEKGFPDNLKDLENYNCVILGSFNPLNWSRKQLDALVNFVKNGGGLIFSGSSDFYNSKTVLRKLVPWKTGKKEVSVLQGNFPVVVSKISRNHPILSVLNNEAGSTPGLTLESIINNPPCKLGADELFSTTLNGRKVVLAALQNFGKGRCLGLGSDTLWHWARKDTFTRKLYSHFWRQAVRFISGDMESGRNISVRWDRQKYRPGDTAHGIVRVHENTLSNMKLNARLKFNKRILPAALKEDVGDKNTYTFEIPFLNRGEYGVSISALSSGKEVEKYEKVFNIAPALPEGSVLAVDKQSLKELADSAKGLYCDEKSIDKFSDKLNSRLEGEIIEKRVFIVSSGPWFFLIILCCLLGEWMLRRKSNLI